MGQWYDNLLKARELKDKKPHALANFTPPIKSAYSTRVLDALDQVFIDLRSLKKNFLLGGSHPLTLRDLSNVNFSSEKQKEFFNFLKSHTYLLGHKNFLLTSEPEKKLAQITKNLQILDFHNSYKENTNENILWKVDLTTLYFDLLLKRDTSHYQKLFKLNFFIDHSGFFLKARIKEDLRDFENILSHAKFEIVPDEAFGQGLIIAKNKTFESGDQSKLFSFLRLFYECDFFAQVSHFDFYKENFYASFKKYFLISKELSTDFLCAPGFLITDKNPMHKYQKLSKIGFLLDPPVKNTLVLSFPYCPQKEIDEIFAIMSEELKG